MRQWRCCAFRSPPFSERNPPGEGRIVTRGVHHAQHRLLDVEVMRLGSGEFVMLRLRCCLLLMRWLLMLLLLLRPRGRTGA